MSVEFERNGEGIYVPADTPGTRSNLLQQINSALGGALFTTSINAFLVLIQLLTVWILWLTYQNTVLPTRQKELLSEQLAQLELERKNIITDIALAKQNAQKASRELEAKQEQLTKIAAEKARLQASVAAANQAAASSLQSAKAAIGKANEASRELYAAQMSLFEQHASIIVASPRLKYMSTKLNNRIREANSLRDNQPTRTAIGEFIREAASNWPNMETMSSEVTDMLRKAQSPLFPKSFSEDLAKYIVIHTKRMNCPMPNPADLKQVYEQKRSAYIVEARASAEKDDAEYLAEGLKKGVRYVFTKEGLAAREELWMDLSDHEAKSAVTKTLDAMAGKCFDDFEAVGSKYFQDKDAITQKLPGGITY